MRWALLVVGLVGCGNPAEHGDAGANPGDGHALGDGDVAVVDAPPDACVPRTCTSPVLACDQPDDGCGTPLACGACSAPLQCGVDAPNVCGVAAADRVCNPSGYCWEHPLPFGMDLNSVWGSGATDVWAAGEGGALLRWNGATWSALASGTTGALLSIWGTAANNIWIVGENLTRRWNGTALVASPGAPTQYMRSVRGLGASDVWMAGLDTYHFDGSTWTNRHESETFAMRTVWPFSATSAWAFGYYDSTATWSGTAWTHFAGAPYDAHAQWGTSATDHWVGSESTLSHWNGTAFTKDASFTSATFALDGLAANDIWAGGAYGLRHFDGAAWSPSAFSGAIDGIWMHTAADAWAVGPSGATASWNGTAWTRRTGFGKTYRVDKIWAASEHDLFTAGAGFMHWHDGVVEDLGPTDPSTREIRALWGSSATDVWAAAADGVFYHWNGAHWTMSTVAHLPSVNAIWGSGPSDVYAVTDPEDNLNLSPTDVAHWDGTAWTIVYRTEWNFGAVFSAYAHGVAGTGPSDVWIVGDRGSITHFDGTAWTDVDFLGNDTIYGVWSSPSGTAWISTESGLYRRAGTTWQLVYGAVVGTRISGTSDTDVWMGDQGLTHWTGTALSTEDTGVQAIDAVATAHAIFAVSASGGIVRKPR